MNGVGVLYTVLSRDLRNRILISPMQRLEYGVLPPESIGVMCLPII